MARRRLEAAIRAGRAIDDKEAKTEGVFTKLIPLRDIDITSAFSGVYSLNSLMMARCLLWAAETEESWYEFKFPPFFSEG